MTGPRPSKKKTAAGSTADPVLAERIDVGPAAPEPVSYGRPESTAPADRVNIGPPFALAERVDGGAPSALAERVDVGSPVPLTVSSRDALSDPQGTSAQGTGTPGNGGR